MLSAIKKNSKPNVLVCYLDVLQNWNFHILFGEKNKFEDPLRNKSWYKKSVLYMN